MNETSGKTLILALVMIGASGLWGCNSAPTRDPNFAPVRPVVPPPAPAGDGAIYHGGFSMNWFEDLRAQRVGDILTVKLSERTNASKSAITSADKSNSNSVENPTLLGVNPDFSIAGRDANFSFDTSSNHSFAGEGASSQNNLLSGDITVTVTEVMPNGYLMIRGEKRIGINQGNEYIKLSGIVRPYDITPENTVASTKIADPTIVYVGDGMVADSNVMGWLSRFFISAVMPF
jgi:flagellar L-ring protein precursor FlgH